MKYILLPSNRKIYTFIKIYNKHSPNNVMQRNFSNHSKKCYKKLRFIFVRKTTEKGERKMSCEIWHFIFYIIRKLLQDLLKDNTRCDFRRWLTKVNSQDISRLGVVRDPSHITKMHIRKKPLGPFWRNRPIVNIFETLTRNFWLLVGFSHILC